MDSIVADKNLVAFCGLYCGACRSRRKGKCPGCHDNERAGWCKIRVCCKEHGLGSCAECREHADPMQCAKFNNFVSKIFAVLLNSNRGACIAKIRELGLDGYAQHMARIERQSLPRRG